MKPIRLSLLLILLMLLPGGGALAGGESAPPIPTGPDPLFASGCAVPDSSSYWVTATVDLSKTILDMRDNSLVVDAGGRPHVAYGGDHLYYAYHDGTAWQVETVDAGIQVGIYASLQLDAAGRPHVAYYDQANDALKYAYHDGTAWQLQTVDADDGMC